MQATQKSRGPRHGVKKAQDSHSNGFSQTVAYHTQICIVGQQRAPRKGQRQGSDVAELDSPESRWVHVEAARKDANLAELAHHLHEHGCTAAARPGLTCCFARRACIASVLQCNARMIIS